ncbi:putative mfs multidrug transporter protein [Botrytis fragariae]|uniref:Putative mfs multidrug transporter protein n=1 Tax=Botrytis fragariae TaxID=1964551 RepID=A0A8H6AH86_9HELO|nr:putative mfs multidrug transporter protein [Botrytis fragariae]KAF5867863.1 putative mfs multidrug transporter protein [Botrytis fragariae]
MALNGESSIEEAQQQAKKQDEKLDTSARTKITAPPTSNKVYIQGLNLWLIASTVALMVFLVVLEIPIVPTCLITISNEIGGFDNASWVISSYLLGRIGVMVIFAKLSDLLTRKFVFTTSIAIFTVFSGACSASKTMTQLIIFRAFQGLGAGGAYSLSTIILIELVPPQKLAKSTAQLAMVTTFANVLGPIIGGAISNDAHWRWIFLLNVPVAAVALLVALFAIPRNFPYHTEAELSISKRIFTANPDNSPSAVHTSSKKGYLRANFLPKGIMLAGNKTPKKLDVIGTILVLLATVTLAAGFQEADSRFPWKSAYVISLLIISGVLWILLVLWERRVTLLDGPQEPVLPWRFLTSKAMTGILLLFFLIGGPLVVTLYQTPQMFQLVYGLNGLEAGIRVVPFTALWAVGLLVSPTLAGRLKVPPIYIVMIGSCIQTVGFALMGTIPVTLQIPSRIYAYEVIAGLGCGLVFPLLFVMVPFVAEPRDRAVGMATGSQFQVMGSTIVLSIGTSIFNGHTRTLLESLLGGSSSASVVNLGETIQNLPHEVQDQIRRVLAEGYNRQSLLLCAAAAAQVPAALLLWRKKQIKV